MELKVEINPDLNIVDFLDVTINVSNNYCKPLSKSNTIPTYINVNSNPSASIVKQIPDPINIRNNLSSSKKIFNNNKDSYNQTLHNSGYKDELEDLNTNKHHIKKGQ